MKLKLISKIALVCAVTFSATSCKDYLLEENPNYTTTDTFWSSLADCEQGLTSVYNSFKDEDMYQLYPENRRSDMGIPGTYPVFTAATDTYFLQTFNNSQSEIEEKWTVLYRGVFRANQVLEALDRIKSDMDEDDLVTWYQLESQARFFRALFHFYLYCTFNEGNVPLVTSVPVSTEDYLRECNPREELQDFVRDEMMYVAELLPEKGDEDDWDDLGRPRAEAAYAILGMTYLYENEPVYLTGAKPNYSEAAKWFKKIIDNSQYAIVDNYGDNFSYSTEFNKESILEINYTYEYNSTLSGESLLTSTLATTLGPSSLLTYNSNLCPAYWLYRTYLSEPVDEKREDNYVDIVTDYHGDMCYRNNDSYYTDTRRAGYRISWVDKAYDADMVSSQIINAVGSYDHVINGEEDGDLYTMGKVIVVDENGDPVDAYKDASNMPIDSYYIVNFSDPDWAAARPFKGLRHQGTWEPQILNENGEWENLDYAKLKSGGYLAAATYESGNPNPQYQYRRLRVNSWRASHSIIVPTEDDMTTYQYFRACDNSSSYVTYSNTWSYFRKYTNWETRTKENDRTSDDSEINFRLIRLADIYLLYAECLIEGGSNDSGVDEALMYINRIRERAGTVLIGNSTAAGAEYAGIRTYQNEVDDPDLYDWANYFTKNASGVTVYDNMFSSVITTAEQIMNHLIYIERPMELAIEGHATRLIDLRRWGLLQDRFDKLSNLPFGRRGNLFPDVNVAESTTMRPGAMWWWSFDPEHPDDEYITSNLTIATEYTKAAQNYTNADNAYFPIPMDEVTANPNIANIKEYNPSSSDAE